MIGTKGECRRIIGGVAWSFVNAGVYTFGNEEVINVTEAATADFGCGMNESQDIVFTYRRESAHTREHGRAGGEDRTQRVPIVRGRADILIQQVTEGAQPKISQKQVGITPASAAKASTARVTADVSHA